jgi:hypothetical protein
MAETGQEPESKAGEDGGEILEDLQPREEESAELKAGVVKYHGIENPHQSS